MKVPCPRAPRPLLLVCLIPLCCALPAQTRTLVESYPDGRPKLHKQEVNGLAEGEWLEWYPDGTLRFRSWWSLGTGDGKWEYFYPSGRLRSETVYDRDQPSGTEWEYHSNGVLAKETVYVRGKRHGIQRTFDVTGTQVSYGRYYRDTLIVDKPARFAPEVISGTESNEWGLTFTASGDTVYFTRRAIDSSFQRIYRSERTGDSWSTPTQVYFSSTTADEGPSLSPDGNQLYFASYRPVPGQGTESPTDMNLWRVTRSPRGWMAPEPLPPTINRAMKNGTPWPYGYEAGPAIGPDGYLYYWTGLTDSLGADIVRTRELADGSWTSPEPVTNLSGPGAQSGVTFSPDGNLACFSAYGQADGYGQEDLYCARSSGNGWAEPLNLGPEINGVGNESGASFSPDGKYFYFTSEREGASQSDIYYLETKYVPFPTRE